MKSIMPLIKIELKNRNVILYFLSIIVIEILLSFFISSEKIPDSGKLLTASIITFVFMGLIMSIGLIENIKNDITDNLIKTYITYPFSALKYIISKLAIYLLFDLLILVAGVFITLSIINYINYSSIELLLASSLYTLFSILAIFLISIVFSRFSIISEIISVFYYFIIFSYTLVSITGKSAISMLPFLYYFSSIIHVSIHNYNTANLLMMPLLFIVLIIFSFILLVYSGWKLFYNFK